jgi:hypothetical protein
MGLTALPLIGGLLKKQVRWEVKPHLDRLRKMRVEVLLE